MGYFLKVKISMCCLFIGCALFSGQAFSQAKSREQQKELARLRAEIDNYRSEILKKEERESNLYNMLTNLEKEIDITHNLLRSLRIEEEEKKRKIRTIENDLAKTEKDIVRLTESFKKRLINFYKYGRAKDLELLLTSASLSQAGVWLRFQKLVAENDSRNIKNIIKKKRHIQNQRSLLQTELAAKERILRNKTSESSNLTRSRKERQGLLDQVKKDKQFLQRRLQESQEALREIENYIHKAENERQADKGRATVQVDSEVSKLKGKMRWPTTGTVISEYGDKKDPQLGTTTTNMGILIKAAEGTPVHCVASGTVSVITWARGWGYFMIVNHGGGYYTVYSHLARIDVEKGEEVVINQIIGAVGDSGSLSGPELHFQIYEGDKHRNPRHWLKPK